MSRKIIHNPKTHKNYSVRQRTTSQGEKGQIMGLHKTQASKRVGSSVGSALRRLSNS